MVSHTFRYFFLPHFLNQETSYGQLEVKNLFPTQRFLCFSIVNFSKSISWFIINSNSK